MPRRYSDNWSGEYEQRPVAKQRPLIDEFNDLIMELTKAKDGHPAVPMSREARKLYDSVARRIGDR